MGGGVLGVFNSSEDLSAIMVHFVVGGRQYQPFVSYPDFHFAVTTGRRASYFCNFHSEINQ